MKHYEHQWIGWAGDDVEDVAARIGPEWRFCSETDTPRSPGGIWCREIPSPEPAAMLMEIGTQLRVLASVSRSDADTVQRIDRLADCVSAIAKGEVVTTEDITGEPSN